MSKHNCTKYIIANSKKNLKLISSLASIKTAAFYTICFILNLNLVEVIENKKMVSKTTIFLLVLASLPLVLDKETLLAIIAMLLCVAISAGLAQMFHPGQKFLQVNHLSPICTCVFNLIFGLFLPNSVFT